MAHDPLSPSTSPVWTASLRRLDDWTTQYLVQRDGRAATFREVISGWEESPACRSFFSLLLREVPPVAYCWETPAVTTGTLDRPFEFVLVAEPELDRRAANPSSFAGSFAATPGAPVVAFPNLGGDAVLVVPAPPPTGVAYPHLAAFLRRAAPEQVEALWRTAGEAMRHRVSGKPVWLSTAGLGVPWLHLRLDARPKYYRHRPYTDIP